MKTIDVVICTHEVKGLVDAVKSCIEVIPKSQLRKVIIIANGGIATGTIPTLPSVTTIADKSPVPLGMSVAKNLGIQHTKANYVMFLDGDAQLTEFNIRALSQDRITAALITEKKYEHFDTVWAAGAHVKLNGLTSHRLQGEPSTSANTQIEVEVDYGPACCLIVPRMLLNKLNGFDATMFNNYFEDVDLCRRAMCDYKVPTVYTPRISCDHAPGSWGKTIGKEKASADFDESLRNFRLKYRI